MTARELPDTAKLIPDQAEKVFTGEIFDVYQWQQELFDGTFATYEMLKRPDTVLVLALDEDDRIVVMHEEQPGGIVRERRIPGGRVDPSDESALAAAQREMKEETGITLSEWKLVEVVQPERKIEWFIHLFIARGITSNGEPHHDPGEKIEVMRLTYEELVRQNADITRLSFFRQVTTLKQLKELFDE